jgi:3-isopropylmalate/(R)-2-methylmalate dehydratase large subunit
MNSTVSHSDKPQSLFEKLWSAHEVVPENSATPAIIYIDLHLIHEVTSPQAFAELRARGLKVRSTNRVLATIDHSTPTLPVNADGSRSYTNPEAQHQVETMARNCTEFGVQLLGWDDARRGIVHVIGPELGATQPGMTIVCGDSHTATHGAFGALAFGIGTTEVGHVLASQCLLQRKPKSMAIEITGALMPGASAKDLILHIIGQIGVAGGTGYVIEYRGAVVQALDMEARMTLCNMSIEAGARAGMIACDEQTIDYLRGRERVPKGAQFTQAAQRWSQFKSDAGCHFDRVVHINANEVQPTVSYGTHPGMVTPINQAIPASADARALAYMQLKPAQSVAGEVVNVVFLGSCTNGRISDLRSAAQILQGRKVAAHVRMLVVPGSESVKREAEAEGLHQIFIQAGAQWREAGCSMCIAMNGDLVAPGELAVSTSNRNFEGRQGKGARTMLASPQTAAACAIAGSVVDPRAYL